MVKKCSIKGCTKKPTSKCNCSSTTFYCCDVHTERHFLSPGQHALSSLGTRLNDKETGEILGQAKMLLYLCKQQRLTLLESSKSLVEYINNTSYTLVNSLKGLELRLTKLCRKALARKGLDIEDYRAVMSKKQFPEVAALEAHEKTMREVFGLLGLEIRPKSASVARTNSKSTPVPPTDDLAEKLLDKRVTDLQLFTIIREQANTVSSMKFTDFARKALDSGRKDLAMRLVEHDPSISRKIAFLLFMKEFEQALERAVESFDPDHL